jgi:hypothetical protein
MILVLLRQRSWPLALGGLEDGWTEPDGTQHHRLLRPLWASAAALVVQVADGTHPHYPYYSTTVAVLPWQRQRALANAPQALKCQPGRQHPGPVALAVIPLQHMPHWRSQPAAHGLVVMP